ncbi:MAG: hypothetical protein GKS00_02760 [Alphaproteobacteria bacterium]|nr:hypothetical protein [Alphaproteobacteria bacterium]
MSLKGIHSGHVLGTAALLAPIAGVFAPLLIAPITIIAILGLLANHALHHGARFHSDRPLIAAVGILLSWAVISLFWTIDTQDAVAKSAVVVGVGVISCAALVLGPSLIEHERHALRRYVLAGVAGGFLLLFFELATSGTISQDVLGKAPIKYSPINMFNRTPSVLLLFVWPAVAILWRSWPLLAIGLIGLGFISAYLLPSTSASIAYTVGSVFFFIALSAPRGASLFLALAIAFGILTAPFLPRVAPVLDPATIRENTSSQNASLIHRLDIWAFTIKKIEERPLIGWGLNASRAIPGGDERYNLYGRDGRVIGQGDRLPLHPHNGALQIWLELGLPGAICFAALFGLAALRTVRQTERAGAAAALAAIATAAPIWLLSFGIWQTWWLAMLVLTAMLTTALVAPNRS